MGTMLTTASIVLKIHATIYSPNFIFKNLDSNYNLDFASLLVPYSKQY